MIGMDLGCGWNKQPELIGVDRYFCSGVDLIADINKGLPFSDDSVDLLFASHVLEHVDNLLATVKEVYRICRHGAQMCVLAPYSEQKLNQANPYHKCNFNEHTPRFWTYYEKTPISREEYCHPQAQQWGLSRSDNSDPGIDIRLVRIEYFYFPQYAGLSPDEQRRFRLERPDVCDQIMYHLIVWKSTGENQTKSFDEYVAEFCPYEPTSVLALRNRAPDGPPPFSAVPGGNMDAFLRRMTTIVNSTDLSAGPARGGSTSGERYANGERQRSFTSAVLEAAREACLVEARNAERLRPELQAAKDEANELRTHTVHLAAEVNRLQERCDAQSELLARRTAELQDAAHNRTLAEDAARSAREAYLAEARNAERLRPEVQAAKEEATKLRADSVRLTAEVNRLQERCDAQSELLARRTAELQDASHNRTLADEAARSAREACLVEVRNAERLRPELQAAKDEANELRAHTVRLAAEVAGLHEHSNAQSELLARRTAELDDAAARNRVLADEGARTARELDFSRADLRRESGLAAAAQQEVATLSERVHELEVNRESNEVLRAKLALTRAELETTATLLALQRQKEEALTSEIAAARAEAASAMQQAEQCRALWGAAARAFSSLSLENRIPEFVNAVRVAGFLLGRHGQLTGLPQEFASLRAYSDQHFGSSRASVMLGGDLNNVPYREYVIPFGVNRLASITAAVKPFLPDSSGFFGVEVVSPDNKILAHVRQRLSTVSDSGLVTVTLPAALSGLDSGWSLRIFVRDAIAPVGLYELARGALLRAKVQYYPFVQLS